MLRVDAALYSGVWDRFLALPRLADFSVGDSFSLLRLRCVLGIILFRFLVDFG